MTTPQLPVRIPPRDRSDWDAEVHEALAVLRPPANAARPEEESARAERPVSNILGIFTWHPALTKGFLAFNSHLFASTLSDRVRELVTVRISWLRGGEYEWAQHVRMAAAAGRTPAEIDRIAEGPDAPGWSPADAALLRATDEIADEHYVGDATWAELERHLDRRQLMDLVFTVGAYDLLAMAFNTFGLQLDPGMEGFPAQAIA